jgi:hypothetical protein
MKLGKHTAQITHEGFIISNMPLMVLNDKSNATADLHHVATTKYRLFSGITTACCLLQYGTLVSNPRKQEYSSALL